MTSPESEVRAHIFAFIVMPFSQFNPERILASCLMNMRRRTSITSQYTLPYRTYFSISVSHFRTTSNYSIGSAVVKCSVGYCGYCKQITRVMRDRHHAAFCTASRSERRLKLDGAVGRASARCFANYSCCVQSIAAYYRELLPIPG